MNFIQCISVVTLANCLFQVLIIEFEPQRFICALELYSLDTASKIFEELKKNRKTALFRIRKGVAEFVRADAKRRLANTETLQIAQSHHFFAAKQLRPRLHAHDGA